MKSKLRVFQLFVLSVASVSCAVSECDYYATVVSDNGTAREIELWADHSVFDTSFRDEDLLLVPIGYMGPGDKIFKKESGVLAPEFVSGHLGVMRPVRTLGPIETEPNAIFFGTRSYAGVVVFRHSIEDDRASVGLSKVPLRATNGRVAAMCREDLEKSWTTIEVRK